MNKNIRFSEFRPSDKLKPFVQTYWMGEFNTDSTSMLTQQVVPNGCIELIIHLSDTHCLLSKDGVQWIPSPVFTILGLFKKNYEVRFPGYVHVFGIRFHPDGLNAVFGKPPAELVNTYENAADVFLNSLSVFCRKIRASADPAGMVNLADIFLENELRRHFQSHDHTHILMKSIRSSGGMTDYDKLTGEIPLSNRQLQRSVRNRYGITITDYIRIARMNAIHQYMTKPPLNLTSLSYEMEFTDQSHFIREFNSFTGMSPGKFMKSKERFIVNPGGTGIHARGGL